MRGVWAVPALILLSAATPAWAAGEPSGGADWTGFYVGFHAGLGVGTTNATITDPAVSRRANGYGSQYGGLQLGYTMMLPSRFVVGLEADISFPNYLDGDNILLSVATASGSFTEQLNFTSSLRGRLGYAQGAWLLYVTGGLAWSGSSVTFTPAGGADDSFRSPLRAGWTGGLGAEWRFDQQWSLRAEYLYSRYGTLAAGFPGAQYSSVFDQHRFRLALSYWPWAATGAAAEGEEKNGATPRFEFHAQSTLVWQGYPPIRALYSGANSLPPGGQARETLSASAFLGMRLWEGGELYYSGELFQGYGLGNTLGAGGFPNGEAQKSAFLYPRYNMSRLYLRHTFGFGGEQEDVESAPNQLSGKRDVSRLSVQAGKFSVKDSFDNNTYASDPRVHFMNWSLWASGAFDYPADRLGLTYGAMAEFNQKSWALRAGYFLVGDQPNSNNFDTNILRRGGYLAEVETRYTLGSQPGKLRLLGWFTNTFAGRYREALDLVAVAPGLDPTTAIAMLRRDQIKFGYAVNVEQAVTEDVGLFARWSWNNGKSEISAFTDIDASLSGGASIKGRAWGRPTDTLGIGAAINGLSKDHRDYLAAGGLGVLVGDGKLNYRTEKVLETFYAIGVNKQLTVTFDYQLLVNPAYNADRGPAHVFAARLHGEI